jgi:hypothetical protein
LPGSATVIGVPPVGCIADFEVERYLAEKFGAEPLGLAVAAAMRRPRCGRRNAGTGIR